MNKHFFQYLLLRSLLFPVSFLPFKIIHKIGKFLGNILYIFHTGYRKRALSNLSLARSLSLTNTEIQEIAKESFQNLATVALEYQKFSTLKDTRPYLICENPQEAQEIISSGQGIVFFCGHLSNWEVLFLEGTQRMPGVAIGRPIKNPYLYQWVLKIREKFGGKMVPPKQGIKEGLRALKNGSFMGIVGDQGMPNSGFYSDFLGRGAWTSPAPAMLAYKTKSPMMVATTKRKDGKYFIHYSKPIWPDQKTPLGEDVPRMMKEALKIFEEAIIRSPGEWLWQHNRWKQEPADRVLYKYRCDSILIIFANSQKPKDIQDQLLTLRKIYPKAYLSAAIPKNLKSLVAFENLQLEKVLSYKSKHELFLNTFAYKMVIDHTNSKALKRYYLKKSASRVLQLNNFKSTAEHNNEMSKTLIATLCRDKSLQGV